MALLSTRSIVAAVVTRLTGTTNVTTYLSQGPTPPVGRTCIVHPLPGDPDGVLGDPDRNVTVRFQTTSIGSTAEQAMWTHDTIVARLNREKLTGTGFVTYPVRIISGSQQPVRRDDDLATALFYVTCSWVAVAQPA